MRTNMNTTTLMKMISDLALLSFQEGCLWAAMQETPRAMEELDAQYEAKQREITKLLLDIQSFVNGEESVSV